PYVIQLVGRFPRASLRSPARTLPRQETTLLQELYTAERRNSVGHAACGPTKAPSRTDCAGPSVRQGNWRALLDSENRPGKERIVRKRLAAPAQHVAHRSFGR